jgi:hypothetical protein
MKSLSIIKSEQSNEFSISARKFAHLFLSLAAVFSVFFSVNVNAAACAPNTNVTVDCEDLVLNGAGVVTVDAAVIVSSAGGVAAVNAGASNSLVNAGVIRGNGGDGFHNNASLDTLRNIGTIRSFGFGGVSGVFNDSIISNFYNSGWINGSTTGLENTGTITSLINASGGFGITGATGLWNNNGTIGTLTNLGNISGSTVALDIGIYNGGTITTLNNVQSNLTYDGNLPINYNIIIRSTTSFGSLIVTGPSGVTTFGIYTGSVVSSGTYSSVLSGLTLANLNNTTGTYNGYTFTLINSAGNIWDLVISGANALDTQTSLANTASALQSTFTLQNTVLANSLSYDCLLFDRNNICISTGGRNTQVQAANGLNNTSALLIVAYRPHPNYRIGAYADQNLSVNNVGSTVNLGNNTPLIGLFGAWNQRLDGTGTEVKVSAAYGQKNTTVTRQVAGGSEPGSGSSQLNSQGAQVLVKYGFYVTDKAIVSPYLGIRYTQNNMGGYTEGTSSSVTVPLAYSALNTNATTVLAGVGASYKVLPAVTTFASAGVETDTNSANGTYSATNASIGTLTPVSFNANPVRTRPTAMLGAYYDITKNQRLGVTGIYRQEAYQAVSTTTVMAIYTIGL